MSTPEFYAPRGALFSLRTELTICRWGGGADPGKYHVFNTGAGYGFAMLSRQCVVDDFGTLVPVDLP